MNLLLPNILFKYSIDSYQGFNLGARFQYMVILLINAIIVVVKKNHSIILTLF